MNMSVWFGKGVRTDADAGGSGDDASVLLLLEDRPNSLRALRQRLSKKARAHAIMGSYPVRAAKVDGNDGVPFSLSHRGERLVAQDTSVGNKDMNAAERVERSLHDALAVFGRADSSNSLAASCNKVRSEHYR